MYPVFIDDICLIVCCLKSCLRIIAPMQTQAPEVINFSSNIKNIYPLHIEVGIYFHCTTRKIDNVRFLCM